MLLNILNLSILSNFYSISHCYLQLGLQLVIFITGVIIFLQIAIVINDFGAGGHFFYQLRQSLLVLCHVFLVVELREAPFHHVLHPELLHAEQIQDHGVCETEPGLQQCRLALDSRNIIYI